MLLTDLHNLAQQYALATDQSHRLDLVGQALQHPQVTQFVDCHSQGWELAHGALGAFARLLAQVLGTENTEFARKTGKLSRDYGTLPVDQ